MAFPTVPGITWMNQQPQSRSNIQIVNGRRTQTFQATYTLRATRVGKITLPVMRVHLPNRPNQRYSTPQLQVTATSVDKFAQLRLLYDGKPTPPPSIYIGQELLLHVELLYNKGAKIHGSFYTVNGLFPKLAGENAVFQEFQKGNDTLRCNPDFTLTKTNQVHTQHRLVDGTQYVVIRYEAMVKPISTGTMRIQASHTIPQDSGQQQRRGFFGMVQSAPGSAVTVDAATPPIQVKSLPAPTAADGHFLGLIGDWKVKGALSESTVKAGDAVDLILGISGRGSIESLMAPKLSLAGFRQFEPKVERKQKLQRGTVRWTLVPTSENSQLQALTLSTFDYTKHSYVRHVIELPLTVEPAELVVGSTIGGAVVNATQDDVGESSGLLSDNPAAQSASGILYIKRGPGIALALPLWHNARLLLIALILLGPALYLVAAISAARYERLAGSDAYRRKHEASKDRSKVLAAIRQASPETLPQVIQDQVAPFLGAQLELPPGATTEEIAAALNDPELAEMLRQADQGSFMPGLAGGIDAGKLAAHVSKIAVFILALSCLQVRGEATHDDAYLAFERGQIEQAEMHYESLLSRRRSNADILYNLGCCAYRQGRFGQSAAYFERARRLNPQDSDIVENLNFVRSQLGQGPVNPSETPGDLLQTTRDRFRPDQWLVGAALLWLFCWVLLALRRAKRWRLLPYGTLCAVAASLCVMAALVQRQTSYRANQALITSPDTGLYPSRLPSSGVVEATTTLGEGSAAEIREQGIEWVRVRVGKDEGWVKANAIQRIW